MSKNLEEYIANWYTIQTYNNIYEHCMLPMEGMSSWPISDHSRPVRMLGRPKKERRRDTSDSRKGTKLSKVGIKMKCRLCRSEKHNPWTCPKYPDRGKKNVVRKRMQAEMASQANGSSDSVVSITGADQFSFRAFWLSSFFCSVPFCVYSARLLMERRVLVVNGSLQVKSI